MKNRLFPLIALILLITVACATQAAQPEATQAPATQPPASPTPNVNGEIVLKMIELLNAGDVEGSLAYFADDAVGYIIGLPLTGWEIYRGKDAIRGLWQDSVANHFEWEAEVESVRGDVVIVHAKTWHDFTRALEVAPLEYFDLYEVIDGKITVYNSTITEEALERFMPAFEAAVPLEPTEMPDLTSPATALTITIQDGTCAYSGPMVLKAGELPVTINVADQDQSLYAVGLFTLEEGKDLLDLMASTGGSAPPSWSEMIFLEELEPGATETIPGLQVEDGLFYMVCFSQPPEMAIGNAGPFTVVP